MNGIHDMGGMHGFGPVVVEEDEPVFHAPWEKTVFAGFAQLAAQPGRVPPRHRADGERALPDLVLL